MRREMAYRGGTRSNPSGNMASGSISPLGKISQHHAIADAGIYLTQLPQDPQGHGIKPPLIAHIEGIHPTSRMSPSTASRSRGRKQSGQSR